MATTNTSFSTIIAAIDAKAQSLASSTTDAKDLVYLGKAIEALNVPNSVSEIIDEGDTQTTRVTTEGNTQYNRVNSEGNTQYTRVNTEGNTQVAAVNSAGNTQVSAVNSAGNTQVSAVNSAGNTQVTAVNSEGNTQVANIQAQTANLATVSYVDTQVAGIVNSAPETLNTLNELAAALGDDPNFATTVTNSIAAKMPLAGGTFTGNITAPQYSGGLADVIFNADVKEKTTISATAATGTIAFNVLTQQVLFYTSNASSNFTVNIRGDGSTTLNSLMAVGDSITLAFLVTNGGTAYYNTAVQVDGSSVTPKWQGGSAPTAGNASSVDIYTYTVIKTGSAVFSVFASQTQFA